MVLPLGFFPKNLIPIGCYCFSGFSSGIHQNIQKARRFGECVGVPGNYSISELKLCRNLTSIQMKNGFPSSLDNALDSK